MGTGCMLHQSQLGTKLETKANIVWHKQSLEGALFLQDPLLIKFVTFYDYRYIMTIFDDARSVRVDIMIISLVCMTKREYTYNISLQSCPHEMKIILVMSAIALSKAVNIPLQLMNTSQTLKVASLAEGTHPLAMLCPKPQKFMSLSLVYLLRLTLHESCDHVCLQQNL